MRSLLLGIRQAKYQNKIFWRNPPAAFFTFLLPLMFLVIFNLLLGNREITVPGGTTHTSTFYVPSIIALSVISACYTNIAMSMTFSRDRGLLKRVRGTPLPSWAFLFGSISNAVLIAVILVVIIISTGTIFYDVDIPTNTMVAMLVTLVLGAATFCSLGIAVTSLIPNSAAAPAIVNASILPLLFISDIFIPMGNAPDWLMIFTHVFPVKPFSSALQTTFNPFESGNGFEPVDLMVMFGWMLFGVITSIRFFSWEPRE